MQPQELEVWYVLPVIRKELALCLIKEHKLTQKKVAGLLNLQESTISQYIQAKRAKEDIFDKPLLKEIKKSAKKVFENSKTLNFEIQRICTLVKEKGILCKLHKQYEGLESCGACLK